MNRYIDADEVKYDIDLVWFCRQDIPDDAIDKMLELIDKEPSADVEPVRHGHWINDIGYAGWTCSECGDHEGNKTDKYCPNCGAKMDGWEEPVAEDFDYWEESGAADAYADHQR